MKKIQVFLLISIVFTSYSLSQNTCASKQYIEHKSLFCNSYSPWVDSVFNSLTPTERISQLIMVAAWSNRGEKHTEEISQLIQKYNIGGLIFFQGGPIRQAQQTNFYQWIAKTPLFIGIDGEWGLGMRLDSTISFPRQMMLGAVKDNQLIYDMGHEIANQLKAIGVNINFAPVVDVNNNPLNPVISNRSFGENKYLVAEKGIAYMQGMQENKIITIAKHFPGHGDTNDDSHIKLPVINIGLDRLDSIELYPFRQLIEKEVGGVMIAHLHVPSLDDEVNKPSTLSYNTVTKLLKQKLGYSGLIFTDALNMKSISSSYKPGEIEVKALEAGNDVLLMPADIPKAINAIKEAIARGDIRQSQIDSSCRKVLAAKEWSGLNNYSPIDITAINKELNSTPAKLIQRKFVSSGITLIQNHHDIIPLKQLDSLRIALVLVGTSEPNKFKETLSLYKDFDCFYLPKKADSSYIDTLLFSLRHYNLVIAGIHNTDSRISRNFGLSNNINPFLDKLICTKSVILTLFASPYALNHFTNLDKYAAILVSYQDQPIIEDYTAQLIFGGIGAKGKLPVTAATFMASTSIKTPDGLRLRYALPEEIDIDSHQLADIDTIVAEAIRKKAMPGCQILAAKNGVVFYHKSFGYYTYEELQAVQNSDIYDIASITKISSTLPTVMKLYEEKRLNLSEKLSAYLPDLKKSNKKDILLIDILTHQARLQPSIPFYLRTVETGIFKKKNLSIATFDNQSGNLSTGYKYREGLYSTHADLEHGLEVADHLFLANSYADSMYQQCKDSKLLPAKKYEYSDIGFYYMYRVIEKLTRERLNDYTETNFYNKLGATTLGFLPLSRFEKSRIVPTENDLMFRKQHIQGYVHDPGSAMLGGICGHAGVFSNANDLAKLMQMYLNNGSYGGEKYFEPSTVDYFTSCPFGNEHNRRGIGFDKPEPVKGGPTCQSVSAKSFGHTGFTGCITWADPETGLLYIFLSNRVYPDAGNNKLIELNVRTRIQEVLSKCIHPTPIAKLD